MGKSNKSIYKFIQLLEEYKYYYTQKVSSLVAKNTILTYHKILCDSALFFDETLNILNRCHKANANDKIFNSFYSLSLVLESAEFSDRENFDIVFYFVKRNLDIGMFQDHSSKNIIINTKKYKKITILCQRMGKENVDDFIHFVYEKHRSGEKMNSMEKAVFELSFGHKDYFDGVVKFTRIIYKNYFSKIDSYNKEDIAIIVDALQGLDVTDFICSSIKRYLYTQLEERSMKSREKEEVVLRFQDVPSKKEKIRTTITNKEYRYILKEVEEFVHFSTLKLKQHHLSLELQNQIAGQLLVLGKSQDDVRKFIANCNPFHTCKDKDSLCIELDQVIQYYKDNYNKYIYYKEAYALEGFLDSINIYIELLEDEYETEWLTIQIQIYHIIKEMESFIPKNYEYELEMAEKQKNKILIRRYNNE